jgi:hypothetical protein
MANYYKFEDLQAYQGGWAALWFYVASHSHLVIRIEKGELEAKYIFFYGCEAINAPTKWEFGGFQLESIPGDPELVRLSDEAGAASILCEFFELQKGFVLPSVLPNF